MTLLLLGASLALNAALLYREVRRQVRRRRYVKGRSGGRTGGYRGQQGRRPQGRR